MKSRRQEKKEELERESWAREEARFKEEARQAALTMWEQIEECDADVSVKKILHKIAIAVGLENE